MGGRRETGGERAREIGGGSDGGEVSAPGQSNLQRQTGGDDGDGRAVLLEPALVGDEHLEGKREALVGEVQQQREDVVTPRSASRSASRAVMPTIKAAHAQHDRLWG